MSGLILDVIPSSGGSKDLINYILNIQSCMHASGIFTEFPMADRLSDINLISRANLEHLPQNDLECSMDLGI